MLKRTTAFVDSNGTAHTSIADAQRAELSLIIFGPPAATVMPKEEFDGRNNVINAILNAREQVIDLLTTTENSRPKARKSNGGTKKRQTPQPATA